MKKTHADQSKTESKPSLPGVFPSMRKDGTPYFRASLTYRRRHISLGSFSSVESAHEAYKEGLRILNDPKIHLMSYHESCALTFEKWVSLINFRDNNIYLGTPIYIGQSLFSYYLSPDFSLKFDLDDLFYFSSHKIMRRGNHYFTADYGMQVNIVNRFGIKNYAVEGRDYLFINGDRTDFRRENLQILNSYNGVSREIKNGQPYYTVRIHIRGNYVVGRYATPQEAAIAYNKAIDILRERGCQKNFVPNYVEGVSPRNYAEIYTRLSVSKKILSWSPTSPNSR